MESRHEGWLALVDQSGRPVLPDDSQVPIRSTLKPFQALPLLAIMDSLGLDMQDMAIAMSSHSGESFHLEAVRRLLNKGQVPESALRCGPHPPIHEPSAVQLAQSGHSPTAIHNNCSGKHAGMLAVARHHGFPLEGYLDPNHPVQELIRQHLQAVFPRDRWEPAIDGCGAPIYALSLQATARAYARLDRRQAEAFRQYPHLIGGTGRLDTVLMQELPVIAKGGAEGLQAGAIPHLGLGWAIKVADGNKRAIGPVVLSLLEALGVWDGTGVLSTWHRPAVTNHAGVEVGTTAPSTSLTTWLSASLRG